jgi:hypothetical protein
LLGLHSTSTSQAAPHWPHPAVIRHFAHRWPARCQQWACSA